MKTDRRHTWVLILLLFVFVAPGLSAYILFKNPAWLGSKATNKGQFLTPPVLLTQLGAQSKWRLILWNPAVCETACMAQLDKLARIRLALGRHLYDVESWLVLGVNAPPLPKTVVNALKERDINLRKISSNETNLSGLTKNPGFFIANTDGYLVLAYELKANSNDIFHDINQLLKTEK